MNDVRNTLFRVTLMMMVSVGTLSSLAARDFTVQKEIYLVDSNNQSFDIPAQDVRFAPNFVQVTFRLPDNIAVGACVVKIKGHNKVSNVGTIRIKA